MLCRLKCCSYPPKKNQSIQLMQVTRIQSIEKALSAWSIFLIKNQFLLDKIYKHSKEKLVFESLYVVCLVLSFRLKRSVYSNLCHQTSGCTKQNPPMCNRSVLSFSHKFRNLLCRKKTFAFLFSLFIFYFYFDLFSMKISARVKISSKE